MNVLTANKKQLRKKKYAYDSKPKKKKSWIHSATENSVKNICEK